MLFNKHFNLEGRHAFLAPSKPAWLKYDDDKLDRVFHTSEAAKLGTAMHQLAAMCITLGQPLPRNNKTVSMFVNDAIGFRMTPEQPLYYSDNCFGTADALGFRNNKLRVHDLKTGVTQTSMTQLMVYAALFCLEYGFRPFELGDVDKAGIELRIYQHDAVQILEPDPTDIFNIMEAIKYKDHRLDLLKEEVSS